MSLSTKEYQTLLALQHTGVSIHHLDVQPGNVFVAVHRYLNDATHHIAEAINNGAIAIVTNQSNRGKFFEDKSVSYIYSNNPREAIAVLASRLYPTKPKHVVAVTGTKGKTSIAHFFAQICGNISGKAGCIGTLGALSFGKKAQNCKVIQGLHLPQEVHSSQLTTPDALTLHRSLEYFSRLLQCDYVAIEASSHGLDQYRLDHCNITAAAFTNLGRDHSDYHENIKHYMEAKARLFAEILQGYAVLNTDVPEFEHLLNICKEQKHRIITYGRHNADICLISLHKQILKLSIYGQYHTIPFHLEGLFQVYNALSSIGLCIASGLNINDVIVNIPLLSNVPGRMELVGIYNGAAIYIDYAHTPESLQFALETLRNKMQEQNRKKHSMGALHLVFGCGGNREKPKRFEMGAIAEKFADHVIVTNDNPRMEDPAQIRYDILSCCPSALDIAEREKAIKYSIEHLSDGDILLLAGKGHETYQIEGAIKYPFDDKEVVKNAINTMASLKL